MNACFFTLRDFKKSGGGSLRISGMINALKSANINTTLITNNDNLTLPVASSLIQIDIEFSAFEKKILQFFLAFKFGDTVINFLFPTKLTRLKCFFKTHDLKKTRIIFCEYIDNSLAFYLKKQKVLDEYVIDLHGIAHVEFLHNQSSKFLNKLINKLKYRVSLKLDKRVLSDARMIVFASNSMRNYFVNIYPVIATIDYKIVPYVLDSSSDLVLNKDLYNRLLMTYALEKDSEVVFFAGGFKKIGGVLDLIHAFYKISIKKNNAILFMLGDGPLKKDLIALVNSYSIEDKVIFAGLIPYSELFTYQQLASVIVCPDVDNIYSNLIVHLKYYDSLNSGKIVINGAFSSVLEINKNENLSLSFEPSNINDLADKIIEALDNKAGLEKKYANNIIYVLENLQYNSYLHEIKSIWEK